MSIKTSRKPLRGNKRSHSMHATKHKQNLNVQKVTIDGVKQRLSVKEIKSLKRANKKAA